jgi:imidazoleglycerol phosphate dehydratase HisB
MSSQRQSKISRNTNETSIEVFLDLDCAPGSGQTQEIEVATGIGFLDHASFVPLVIHLTDRWELDVSCAGKARRTVSQIEVQGRSLD